MIKAVITDFDGVIRHWTQQKTHAVEAQCKLDKGTLQAICFQPELLKPAIVGECTKEEWFRRAHACLQERFGLGIADHYIKAWQNELYHIDHALIAEYQQLFPKAHLALATNATTGFPQELADAGLTHQFDSVFNSSAMGVAKPARHYFHAVLMSLGVAASEVIFIDDSERNVATAREMGIMSVHYKQRSQVVGDLTDMALKASLLAESV